MTRREFIDGYVLRSDIALYATEDGFHIPGMDPWIALPCTCDEEGCEGWAMISTSGTSVVVHLYTVDRSRLTQEGLELLRRLGA